MNSPDKKHLRRLLQAIQMLEMEKAGMADQLTQEQMERIAEALASVRKIEAIKLYREATGKDLKEAKEFIDALIPKLKEWDPEKYKKL